MSCILSLLWPFKTHHFLCIWIGLKKYASICHQAVMSQSGKITGWPYLLYTALLTRMVCSLWQWPCSKPDDISWAGWAMSSFGAWKMFYSKSCQLPGISWSYSRGQGHHNKQCLVGVLTFEICPFRRFRLNYQKICYFVMNQWFLLDYAKYKLVITFVTKC